MPPLAEPLDMVTVHGGTFRIGSSDSDTEAYENEKPQHTVTVSAFCISRYLVTRQLYREILGQAPGAWGEDTDDERFPANEVSWFEAVAFCNALSVRVGLQPCYHITGQHVEWDTSADGYRLPTEAEWEYACRAGTTSTWFFGDDPTALGRYAWFTGNSGDRVHPVGEKEANPWGLHEYLFNNPWHG
jgi:formylglycine-generating enzyme required for sulfatase activity